MRGDVQIVNPAKRWFEWNGGNGTISYYDKETKENVVVPTPFTFLLLETYTTMRGFDKAAGSGIYGNEVKDTNTEKLNIRSGKNSIAIGLYKDIKDEVVAKGGKYAQSCYIAYKEDGKLVIGNFMMSGSSFGGGTHKPENKQMKDVEVGAWLAFTKTYASELMTKAVTIEGKDERACTNGNVTFYVPKFKLVDISPETDKEAIALTKTLKAYMTEYFKKAAEENHVEEVVAEQVDAAHQAVFGGSPATLTEQEKTFLVKEKPQDAPLNEMGELPMETSFVDDSVDPDDLPF